MGSISKSSMMIKEVSRSANPALIWPGVGTNIRLFPVTPTAHLYVGTVDVSITVQGIAQAWVCALPLWRGSLAEPRRSLASMVRRERPGTTPQTSGLTWP